MPDPTLITVTRFEVDFKSGTPTMARIIAYEDSNDRHGYAVAALGKGDPQNKLLAPAILALATSFPDVPGKVQIQINNNMEIVRFIFS